MGTQVTYAENLPEISSEFIEPYVQRFFMMQLESLATGLTTPSEARDCLNGVDYFITEFGGIHVRLATGNIYGGFCRLSDEDMIIIARKTFNPSQEVTGE